MPATDAGRNTTVQLRSTLRDGGPNLRIHTTKQLETLLQQRLHFLAAWGMAVWLSFALVIAVTFWRAIVARPLGLFIRPPLLGYVPFLCSAFLVVWSKTRATRSASLQQLRALEMLLFSPGAVWSAALWAVQLRMTLPAIGAVEAMASAVFWVVAVFAYSVFIPNSWRRCGRVVASLVLLALVPDVVVLAANAAPLVISVYYVALKTLVLLAGATLAIYGAYRIDSLEVDAAAARELGQYTVHERLGGGGMGEVYRASHRMLRRPCAIKLIRPDLDDAGGALLRFEREVQATSALTHPNTVQVYDYGRADDGTFYYVMEYLPGQTIDEIVTRDGPMAPSRVAHLLAQVCEALHEAHAQGLVHRDIKPGNIMICERGGIPDVAKVVDFGLVGSFRAPDGMPGLTQAGMIVGTPAFMSPEQILGETATAASDLYSLGAVAWFMLRGAPLFGDRGTMQMLVAHMHEEPPPLASPERPVPAHLEEAVRRCLAKDPSARFPSALALRDALLSRG